MEISILFKILAALLVLVLAACVYVGLLNRKENRAKKKKNIGSPHSISPTERELPEKYTKRQLKDIKDKVDNLENKYSELEKKLTDLLEMQRKDIKEIQELKTKFLPISSTNPSPMPSNNVNKNKSNIDKERSLPTSNKLLTIGGNGNLIHCEEGYPAYYRAWKEKEKIKFEFVNSDRTKKAINNRSTFIEPFCNKTEESKLPDESDHIETITPGILNDDYTVNVKAVIRYK
jgi:hypothetical protein